MLTKTMYSGTLYFGHLGTGNDCPDYAGVLISGVEAVLHHSIVGYYVGSWDMCPYYIAVLNSGVWIRGVSAIQGSGLEGCLQFRGLD